MNSKMSVQNAEEDHIWINASVNNTTDTPQVVNFTNQFSQPIVMDPSRYNITIVSFSLPAGQLPLFIWTDPSPFWVTLSNGATNASQNVIHIPCSDVPSEALNLYSVESFIDSINAALSLAYDGLVVDVPTLSGPPFMSFDSAMQLFSLWAPPSYITTNTTVWFNQTLYVKFGGFDFFKQAGIPRIDHKDYQLRIVDRKNNIRSLFDISAPSTPVYYYVMQQEDDDVTQLLSLRKTVFKTQVLPVQTENLITNETIQTTTSNISSVFIDFVIDTLSLSTTAGANTISYFGNPYRLIPCTGSTPIKRFDMQLFWLDDRNVEHPISIDPGTTLAIKICFIRKGLDN